MNATLHAAPTIAPARATLPIAQAIFRDLSRSFSNNGWTLAMFGSTIKDGEGKDIDLIAVPWVDRPTAPRDTMLIAGLDRSPDPYFGLLDTECHKILYRGIAIDLAFRLAGTPFSRTLTERYWPR